MRNQNHYERIFTIAITAASVLMSGCTDADREMAARKGDGTETFKFKPPHSIAKSEVKSLPTKRNELQSTPKTGDSKASRSGATEEETKTVSANSDDTFVYRPSPQLVKQMSGKKED